MCSRKDTSCPVVNKSYLVLVLENVLGIDGVPDSDFAGLVGRGDVEAGRGVAGAQNLARVLGCNSIDILGDRCTPARGPMDM